MHNHDKDAVSFIILSLQTEIAMKTRNAGKTAANLTENISILYCAEQISELVADL
jgi:hypothetical protein